ncbi:MAG: ankyrin repeat domain-containing protein [Gammaproteobacteria bacterium]|nr:ankyrin repeat domain-containing protein [Gammaproteobacteria bacterium]
MPKYSDLKDQLKHIKMEVLGRHAYEALYEVDPGPDYPDNPYDLNNDVINDFRITVDTLIRIIDDIDIIKNINNVWFFSENLAPIHLEDHPDDNREASLIDTLVKLFIQSFNNVKEHGHATTVEFIKKLNGNCIDARTRSAFDFALQLDALPTFTELFERSRANIPEAELTYFRLFYEILTRYWGTSFKADKGEHGIYRHDGLLNSDLFKSIQQLLSLLGLDPDTDYLEHFKKTPTHYENIYCNFLLETPDLENLLSLAPEKMVDESWLAMLEKTFLIALEKNNLDIAKIIFSQLSTGQEKKYEPYPEEFIPQCFLYFSEKLLTEKMQNILLKLVDHLSQDAVDDLLTIVKKGWYVLGHRVADTLISQTLIAKASVEIQHVVKRFQTKNIYAISLFRPDEKIIKALHAKIKSALTHNLLINLDQVDTYTLQRALLMKPANGGENLWLRALYQGSAALVQALITKTSAQKLSDMLLQKTIQGDLALFMVLSYHTTDTRLMLINKVSSEALSLGLIQDDKNKWTALHMALHSNDIVTSLTLINKVSQKALSEAIVQKNELGWTVLHLAISSQSLTTCLALIDKVTSVSLGAAIIQKNNYGDTVLHTALRLDTSTCLALIAKATPDALSAALMEKNNRNETALHIALTRDTTICLALIKKVSAQALANTLMQKNIFGMRVINLIYNLHRQILPLILFKVLTALERLSKEVMAEIKYCKHDVKNYILSMPDSDEKRQILNDALNPATQLGLYFTLPRNLFNTRINHGALKELDQARQKMNATDAAYVRHLNNI